MLGTGRAAGLAHIELLRFAFNHLCEADLGSTVLVPGVHLRELRQGAS
jgi:hypothetical protein